MIRRSTIPNKLPVIVVKVQKFPVPGIYFSPVTKGLNGHIRAMQSVINHLPVSHLVYIMNK